MQDELDIHRDFMHSIDILITNLINSVIDTHIQYSHLPGKTIELCKFIMWFFRQSLFVNVFHYETRFYSDGLKQKTLLSNQSLL